MLKKSTCWSVLIYGLFIILLGYWGHHKAGSNISFYMGLAFGGLLLLSAFLMFAQQKFGGYAAVILTLVLTATFGIRYSMTGKEVPAMMAVLSGGMLLFLLAKTAKWNK